MSAFTNVAFANAGLQTWITIADAKRSPAVYIDGGAAGDSLGDQYIFDQPLLDASGKKIGINSGFCLRTLLNHSLQCQWTLTFKDGSIQVAGREHDQGESTLAIVGGTGIYQHISGEMSSVKNKQGNYRQTLRFTLNE